MAACPQEESRRPRGPLPWEFGNLTSCHMWSAWLTPRFISSWVSVRVPDRKSCGNHLERTGRLSAARGIGTGSAEAGKWPETKALLRVKRRGLSKVTGQEGQHPTAACSAAASSQPQSLTPGPRGTLVASPGWGPTPWLRLEQREKNGLFAPPCKRQVTPPPGLRTATGEWVSMGNRGADRRQAGC